LLLLAWSCACARAPSLSVLGTKPDWSSLEAYQETLTRKDFETRLSLWSDPIEAEKYLRYLPEGVELNPQGPRDSRFYLRFAAKPEARRPIPAPRHPVSETRPSQVQPLAGLRVALDPGHLGGEWARMEHRWFRPTDGSAIAEGDLTLQTAKKLSDKLESLGAEVILVRDSSQPITPLRPEDLRHEAEKALDSGQDLNLENPAGFQAMPREEQVQHLSELLFYRVAEIRARGAMLNQKIRPDLTVCLHFNAYDWGDPENPKSAGGNHLHILVPGAAEPGELALEDIRFEVIEKILRNDAKIEVPLAESIANALAKSTGLPPALVPGGTVKKVGDNPYVWARNLLANRIYQSPTVYIEAYVMNHPEAIARIQAGDFSGTRKIAGIEQRSLFEDYANGVAQGVLNYELKTRR